MGLISLSYLKNNAIRTIGNKTTDLLKNVGDKTRNGWFDPLGVGAIGTETAKIKTSIDGMNPHLLAHISAEGIGTVVALVVDGSLSQESTWSTPFENSNPENKTPSLAGVLQSGEGAKIAEAVAENKVVQTVGLGGVADNVAQTAENASGRSSFTKVNSTQIFMSSQSSQIQLVLLFSAWSDAKAEVESQIGKLHQMVSPKKLLDKTLVQNAIENPQLSTETFLPSEIPPKITLKYGGKTYTDLIMQNFQRPLSGLMDKNGNLVQAEVNITLIGYQAWDAQDVSKLY